MSSPDKKPSDSTPTPRWSLSRSEVLGVFVLTLLGLVSRRPDQWFAPQFWAEDGKVFFSDAVTQGWGALLKPYAGYLHMAPRLIAGMTKTLPWESLPMVYASLAGLVSAGVAVRIACARLLWWERLLGAAALIAVPHSGEVFLNITNLQWILDVLLVVNLLEAAPESCWEANRRAFELTLAALSTPMVIVLVPFAVVWSWRWRRLRLAWPLAGIWLIAALIQMVWIIVGHRFMGASVSQVCRSLPVVVPRYAATFFTGNWSSGSEWLRLCATGGGLAALLVLLADRTNSRRGRGLGMLLMAALMLLAGRMAVSAWPNPLGGGARYVYMPFVMVMWTLASLAVGTRRWSHRILALSLYALAVCAAASAWRAQPPPDKGWPQQVREAKAGLRMVFEVNPDIRFPVPVSPVHSP